ncbi:PspC domain-containing protein [Streptomyces reniochalinae]|uniref:PspC domain-containing protein n=1 Tax=Streptomyces reniochalinae TaxID=2250578 RepID=A0A367EMC3_9ACTN|nr:PspC domain-containing protein [Streptomyces reniochalinae]RCG19258.1 PspC domain-containing protein [Streptomyces reniochalinae]
MSEDEQRGERVPEEPDDADRTRRGTGEEGTRSGGGAREGAGTRAGAGPPSGAGTSSGTGAPSGTGASSWGAHNPPPRAPQDSRLRRSRAHKVAGGVCGGLGRYFDLDPVIFRVPLAVLSVVGGFGLIFYGFAWLLIPAEGESQNEGRRLLSGRVEGSSLSAVLVALVGCGLFLASLGGRSVPFSVLLIGTVAGAAYWSRHRRQAEAARGEGARVDPAMAHAVADAPPETQAPPVAVPASWWREPLTKDGSEAGTASTSPWSRAGAATGYLWGPESARPHAAPPSAHARGGGPFGVPVPAGANGGGPPARQGAGGGSLGGLTFLLALVAGGVSAAATWEGRPLATILVIGLSSALAVFGLGLGVSAFVGRTGPGTLFCLVLTAGLLAGAAALPKDISTHVRDTRWVPAGAQQVEPRYALGSGAGELDLTEAGLKAGQTVRSGVRIGAGEAKVVVPRNAVVKLRTDVGMGETVFPRSLDGDGNVVSDSSGGLGTTRRITLRPFDGARPEGTVELDMSVGLGRVEIVRELPSGERSDRQQPPGEPAPGGTAPGDTPGDTGPGAVGPGEHAGAGAHREPRHSGQEATR